MISAHHRSVSQPDRAGHRMWSAGGVSRVPEGAVRTYDLVVTVVHDAAAGHRPLLALRRHLPILEYAARADGATAEDLWRVAALAGVPADMLPPQLQAVGSQARLLCRPFVLRVGVGETLHLYVTNLLPTTSFGLALVDDDFGILPVAGEQAAILPGASQTWALQCNHSGIFPMYNRACSEDAQRRCLLGVLIVEP